MSPGRIAGMALRYAYLYKRSLPRLFEIIFWPVMDLLVWGFLTSYLVQSDFGAPAFITFLIGAMIFWDIMYRSQQGVTLPFLEDMWGRSILNVFISPIRTSEMLAATVVVSMAKISLTVTFLSVLAYSFYSFDILSLGLYLVPFFANLLITGWAVGLVTTALIIRWGQAAEALAWGVPFLLQPFSAVFYPVAVLPTWLQPVSLAMPTSHVFEGMREVMATGTLSLHHLAWAVVLNAIWLVLASLFFHWMIARARHKGLLAKLGTQ
jgi:ABC-2 type transport system permease protein